MGLPSPAVSNLAMLCPCLIVEPFKVRIGVFGLFGGEGGGTQRRRLAWANYPFTSDYKINYKNWTAVRVAVLLFIPLSWQVILKL